MNDRDKKARVIGAIALVIGVLGLSLGFAAYSQTLTIKSNAEVNPDGSLFNIDFSSNSSSVEADPIVPVLNPTSETGFSATNVESDNSDSGNAVIKNLHAVFTKPGQSATYNFYTKNAGDLKAYLKGVTFTNVSGESSIKKCTAKNVTNPATPVLVQSACQGINVKVTVGSEVFSETKLRSEFASATAHDLAKNGSEPIKVVISYDAGSEQADGPFDVEFGDVVLLYSSSE